MFSGWTPVIKFDTVLKWYLYNILYGEPLTRHWCWNKENRASRYSEITTDITSRGSHPPCARRTFTRRAISTANVVASVFARIGLRGPLFSSDRQTSEFRAGRRNGLENIGFRERIQFPLTLSRPWLNDVFGLSIFRNDVFGSGTRVVPAFFFFLIQTAR